MTNPTPEDILAILRHNPHPKQIHLEMAGGFAYITIDTHKIAYDGKQWFACSQQITPRFSMNSLHREIDRVFVLAQKIKADCVGLDLPTEQTDHQDPQPKRSWVRMPDGMTQGDVLNTERDELQKKVDFIDGRTSDLLAERDGLFAKIKVLTEERDTEKSAHNYAQNLLNQVWDATGWLEQTNEPCAIEYLKRLKSKADREELLTVEVAKLQEGVKNYKAQVDGLTEQLHQLRFERDAERVGNKWLSETIEDLKRTTVKLPNEHTLRRLFNRHNTPDKYQNDQPIPTMERLLLTIENLCRTVGCSERRYDELAAISNHVNTESEDAHALLDEMNIPRWTSTQGSSERYLSLSARIRSLFQTHTKA